MDVRKDEDIILLTQYGIHPMVKDITVALSDPIFYYEYIITDIIKNISQTWQDQKLGGKKRTLLHDNLFALFFTSNFNTNQVSKDGLKNTIENKIQYGTKFDISFKDKVAVQAEMLDYLSMGDWRYKDFTVDDKVYLISYNNENELPLIWMVISVNKPLRVARLHVWSYSLLSYFVQIFDLQTFQMYRGLASFCLGHQLSVLGNEITRLYYSPFKRDKMTTATTSTALMKLTNGLDTSQQAQDEKESLGEVFYIPIDDQVRKAYQLMTNLHVSKVEMCIFCETKVGTYYTEEYGKDVRFCGQECLHLFL